MYVVALTHEGTHAQRETWRGKQKTSLKKTERPEEGEHHSDSC